MDFSFRERDRRSGDEDLARDPWRRSPLQRAEAYRDFSRTRRNPAALRAHPAYPQPRRIKDEQARRRRARGVLHPAWFSARGGAQLAVSAWLVATGQSGG